MLSRKDDGNVYAEITIEASIALNCSKLRELKTLSPSHKHIQTPHHTKTHTYALYKPDCEQQTTS